MSKPSSIQSPNVEETGERQAAIRSTNELPQGRWTAEMIVGLDWRKIVEIARALAVNAKWEAGGTQISPDGMAEFAMIKGSGSATSRLVARLAPWNRWTASQKCIERFMVELAAHAGVRGTYLAPGGASPAAQALAKRRGIEILDAATLAAVLNGLPLAHSEFFHDLTLSGQPFVPSCPVCLQPLSQSSETEERGASGKLPDVSYHMSDVVEELVVARRIEILRNCEVQFLRGVRARDVFVQGVVSGDFVCEGSLLLNPGGVLTGSVAARSVNVRPGAELHGETRIINESLDSADSPEAWVWTCENLKQQEECESVCFLPH